MPINDFYDSSCYDLCMEGSIEKGPEKIPTRDEVLEVISSIAESAEIVRELSDEQGLYLLEAKIECDTPGETTQYEYIRKGRYPDGNQSAATVIHIVYYENEMPVGGHNVADYNYNTGKWDKIEPEPALKPESHSEVSREWALAAYKDFVDRGVTSPDSLDLTDPVVVEANRLFEEWVEQVDGKAEGNEDAEQRVNLEKTMFYIDAGFTDPVYLQEVLGWLAEDATSVEKLPDDPDKVKLRKDVADAIRKVRGMIRSV
jgi:hypothetical protein